MGKYDVSFEVDNDEIPIECPICGKEFQPLNDFIDTDYYKDGYRTMLYCSYQGADCNYKKVLSYETNSDVEQRMADEENDIDEDDEDIFENDDYEDENDDYDFD